MGNSSIIGYDDRPIARSDTNTLPRYPWRSTNFRKQASKSSLDSSIRNKDRESLEDLVSNVEAALDKTKKIETATDEFSKKVWL